MEPVSWVVGLFIVLLISSFVVERLEPVYLRCFDRVFGTDNLAQWEENSRPLSDEEFLARCNPGVRPETALKVRAILADFSGIPEAKIHPEHRLVDDLKFD
jgi:hypothetical protein